MIYWNRSDNLNSTIAPFSSKDFVMTDVRHKEILQVYELEELEISPSLKATYTALQKITEAIVNLTNVCAVEKEKIKGQYRDCIIEKLNPIKIKYKRQFPKSCYFKGENRIVIALLNSFLRKASEIGKELGIIGIYEYCLFCSLEFTKDQSIFCAERLKDIMQNAGKKMIYPVILKDIKYSKKIEKLKAFLKQYLSNQSEIKSCIIFVNERIMAYMLFQILMSSDLFDQQDPKPIGLVMGHTLNTTFKKTSEKAKIIYAISRIAMDPETQQKAIDDFRNKKTCVLVATDVVEEGLDVPSCNLVCCFDNIKNVKSYVQMQGRARETNSEFVVMTQEFQVKKTKDRIEEFVELIKTSKDLALHATKTISPNKDSYSKFKLKESEFLEIAKTGAKVCLGNARTFLRKYCQSLPIDEFCPRKVEFEYETMLKDNIQEFIANATLPPLVPKEIRFTKGRVICKTKEEAEDNVSFEVIIKLFKLGKLNKFLLSTSKHGSNLLQPEEQAKLPEISTKAPLTPFMNETLKTKPNNLKLFLYKLELNPMFPYINQKVSLGFLHWKYFLF